MRAERKPIRRMAPVECWDRLRAGVVGRVAWTTPDGPEILPVTYAVLDDLVVFRTSPFGALAELRNPQQVAFEVDEVDARTRSGWSVRLRGTSRAATRADELVELWALPDFSPWAAGERHLFVVIVPHRIDGRVIRPAAERGVQEGTEGAEEHH